jgi:hypothetical protein
MPVSVGSRIARCTHLSPASGDSLQGSRLVLAHPKENSNSALGSESANPCYWSESSSGYRMREVNSRRESRRQRDVSSPRRQPTVHSRPPEMAQFLGFSGPIVGQRDCPHGACWRREWDSNPRYARAYNGFRDRPVRPLRHPSARDSKGLPGPPSLLPPDCHRSGAVAITNPTSLPRRH